MTYTSTLSHERSILGTFNFLDACRGKNPNQDQAPADRQRGLNDGWCSAMAAVRAHFFEPFVRVFETRAVTSQLDDA